MNLLILENLSIFVDRPDINEVHFVLPIIRNQQKLRTARGFTMVELMVVLLILASWLPWRAPG